MEVAVNIVDKVTEIIRKPVETEGYEIISVEYLKEDGVYYLRVIIDKDIPITIDDCVIVSKIINPLLDEEDFITDNYILDVCSK